MGTASGAVSLDTSHLEDRVVGRVEALLAQLEAGQLEAGQRLREHVEELVAGLRGEVAQLRELLLAGQDAPVSPAELAPEQVHVPQHADQSAPAATDSLAVVSSPPVPEQLPVPLDWVPGQVALYRRVRTEAAQRGMAPSQVLRELGWPGLQLSFAFEVTVEQLDAVARELDPVGWQVNRGGGSA